MRRRLLLQNVRDGNMQQFINFPGGLKNTEKYVKSAYLTRAAACSAFAAGEEHDERP